MRILFLTSSMSGGGAERVAALLCNAWAEQGHDVTLMPTFSGRGECSYPLAQAVRLNFLADEVAGATGRLRRLWALRRFIRRTGPNIVISFLTDVNVAALLASLGTGVPVIVSERIYPPLLSPPPSRAVHFLRRTLYRLAHTVVVQTETTKMWVASHCPGSRIEVVPNPFVFPIPLADPAIPFDKHVTRDKKIILAVGRLHDQKRFDLLLSVFANVAYNHPDWDLVILGEGPQRAALETQVVEATLTGRVHMPGFVGNLGDWYDRADIYVMTSSYEGLPNTLIEAMAHGVPAIAFDVKAGPGDILELGGGILLPDNNHVQRLVESIEALIRDQPRRNALGAAAQQVRERYAVEKILGDWNAILEDSTADGKPNS